MGYRKKIIKILFFLLIIPFIYLYTWNNVFVSTGLALLLSTIILRIYSRRENYFVYITGFILGTTGELFAVHHEVWLYTKPLFAGIPPFIPIFWGYAFVCFNELKPLLLKEENMKNTKEISPCVKDLSLRFIEFLLLIIITITLQKESLTASILFLCIIFFQIYKTGTKHLFVMIWFGIAGPLFEMFTIHHGIWEYPYSDFLYIPLWLPFLYASFASVVYNTSEILYNLLYYQKLRELYIQ